MSGVALSRWLEACPNGALVEVVAKAETAITTGAAALEDYELFVLGRQELARRTGEGGSSGLNQREAVFG